MKRLTVLLLVFIFSCMTISCGKEITAEEAANKAYSNLTYAYRVLEEFNEDFTNVMKFTSSGKEKTIKNISKGLKISEDDLLNGFIKMLRTSFTDEYNEEDMNNAGIYLENKEQMAEYAQLLLNDENDVLGNMLRPMLILYYAYEVNGSTEKISSYLLESDNYIKTIEQNFPNYEHLQELKDLNTDLKEWNSFMTHETLLGDYMKFWTNYDFDFLDATFTALETTFE